MNLFQWSRSVAASETESWETRLLLEGHTQFVCTEQPGRKTQIEAFFDSKTEAEAFRREFGGEVRPFAVQNWAALGTAGSTRKTIRIRDRLILALDQDPEFLAELREQFPRREILCFPPEMAFGTGDHPTTATCLRFLCDVSRSLPRDRWKLLDLGTGTGVLAIAACRLGAIHAVASDFDPKAIEVARASMQRHDLDESRIELREEDVLTWRPSLRYEVVAANLFSSILIRILPKIRRSVRANGWVILSGILREQSAEVKAVARENGLKLERKVQRGKWVGILARPA